MQQVLTDPGLCGWPPDQATVRENPTDVRRVVVTMRQLARATRDVLLIYFVGHGVLLPRGDCAWHCPTQSSKSPISPAWSITG